MKMALSANFILQSLFTKW